MVHAKNYETVSTFVKVMPKKTVASFFFWTRCRFFFCIVAHFCLFLPRDATQSAVMRLHVFCPSVTLRYVFHTVGNTRKNNSTA